MLGGMLCEVLDQIAEGCLRAYGTTWFEDIARQACEAIAPVRVEVGMTAAEVLVTVRKDVFNRNRLVSSARVRPWDGSVPWEEYVEVAVRKVYTKVRQDAASFTRKHT